MTECVVRSISASGDNTLGGGGIYNYSYASLTPTQSTISDNAVVNFLSEWCGVDVSRDGFIYYHEYGQRKQCGNRLIENLA